MRKQSEASAMEIDNSKSNVADQISPKFSINGSFFSIQENIETLLLGYALPNLIHRKLNLPHFSLVNIILDILLRRFLSPNILSNQTHSDISDKF
jgi:hypothetical protein